jgi:putative redox protein
MLIKLKKRFRHGCSVTKMLETTVKIEHRAVDAIPAVFTNIQVHFILEGDLDADKIEKAIQLSMDKYCSVTKMLETTVKIEHSFEISSKD